MLISDNFYIEVASENHRQSGQMCSGDVFLHRRYTHHVAVVLCNGGGCGSKANVVASVMASMALNHTQQTNSLENVAKSVLPMFTNKDSEHEPSLTLITVTDKAEVKVVEYGTPKAMIWRGDKEFEPTRTNHNFVSPLKKEIQFTSFSFTADIEDRIFFCTNGVLQSGLVDGQMPHGWSKNGVGLAIEQLIKDNSTISAKNLCHGIVDISRKNDNNMPHQDMSCGAIYFRKPRKLLVCTGPPYDMRNDTIMASIVNSYSGDIIVSGGSTSQIIARELGRELQMANRRDISGLPSSYKMDGIKMVTEGVLTLGRVKGVLEKLRDNKAKGEGIDIVFVNEFLDHDVIDFIVGTKINELHQNPNIPIELELRRTVISDIARILESKFMKAVTKKYL